VPLTSHLRWLAWLSCLLLGALLSSCHAPPLPPESSPVSPQVAAGDKRGEVLLQALGLVGTPYLYGGNTPEGGFDCSGLIGYVFRSAAGVSLPRTTAELMALRAPRIARKALDVGDLLFFSTDGSGKVSHAGIYSGDGRFVHAPSSGGTVRLDSLSNRYWSRHYLGASRVLLSQ